MLDVLLCEGFVLCSPINLGAWFSKFEGEHVGAGVADGVDGFLVRLSG